MISVVFFVCFKVYFIFYAITVDPFLFPLVPLCPVDDFDFERMWGLENPIMKYLWLKKPVKCQKGMHFERFLKIFDLK